MEYIKGKFRKTIYENSNGYVVGLFRVNESSLSELVNKTVTFTGYFAELTGDVVYLFNGKYIFHEKYGDQFQVSNYELVKPEGKDSIVEFLSSSFIKGCGESTAKKIVKVLGDDAIKLIKEDKNNLVKVGLSDVKTNTIYKSIMMYYDSDELIIELTNLGFSSHEITKLLSIYGKSIRNILKDDLYSLIDIVDFKKLDKVYFNLFEENTPMRTLALIIEVMKRLTFEQGDTYLYREEIINGVKDIFNVELTDFDELIETLIEKREIEVIENRFYIKDVYKDEENNASRFSRLSIGKIKISNIEDKLKNMEKEFGVKYNDEQKKAIISCLKNRMTIITGGPGTGKTTIINALVKMYQDIHKYTFESLTKHLALLAPTGRASKRMSEASLFPASTIHRYLKWNKETLEFGVNEYNKNEHDFIIIDEASMLDNNLMSALFKGTNESTSFVFVGDDSQLPSVSPGNILKDLIDTEVFTHIKLKNIYRQSENSFIPILANDVKEKSTEIDLLCKKDDYNFLECDSSNVRKMLEKIIDSSIKKGLNPDNVQILVPMYKGENGIDNLNILLQNILNPKSDELKEIKFGSVVYRVNDKVINLQNNIDENIYNGDIGYIVDINPDKPSAFMTIDFYGRNVIFKREDLNQIRHAYAMSIHKSQGSEFDHVIMPITNEYRRMLYNKLLYTGISRAKKSLVLIGSVDAFKLAVNNTYSIMRKTYLKESIMNKLN